MTGNGNGLNGKKWWVFGATIVSALVALLTWWGAFRAGERSQGAATQSVSDRLEALEEHVRESKPLVTELHETNAGMRENKAAISALIVQVNRLAALQEQDRAQGASERSSINESIRHLTNALINHNEAERRARPGGG